jgi:hypothetical protein
MWLKCNVSLLVRAVANKLHVRYGPESFVFVSLSLSVSVLKLDTHSFFDDNPFTFQTNFTVR